MDYIPVIARTPLRSRRVASWPGTCLKSRPKRGESCTGDMTGRTRGTERKLRRWRGGPCSHSDVSRLDVRSPPTKVPDVETFEVELPPPPPLLPPRSGALYVRVLPLGNYNAIAHHRVPDKRRMRSYRGGLCREGLFYNLLESASRNEHLDSVIPIGSGQSAVKCPRDLCFNTSENQKLLLQTGEFILFHNHQLCVIKNTKYLISLELIIY